MFSSVTSWLLGDEENDHTTATQSGTNRSTVPASAAPSRRVQTNPASANAFTTPSTQPTQSQQQYYFHQQQQHQQQHSQTHQQQQQQQQQQHQLQPQTVSTEGSVVHISPPSTAFSPSHVVLPSLTTQSAKTPVAITSVSQSATHISTNLMNNGNHNLLSQQSNGPIGVSDLAEQDILSRADRHVHIPSLSQRYQQRVPIPIPAANAAQNPPWLESRPEVPESLQSQPVQMVLLPKQEPLSSQQNRSGVWQLYYTDDSHVFHYVSGLLSAIDIVKDVERLLLSSRMLTSPDVDAVIAQGFPHLLWNNTPSLNIPYSNLATELARMMTLLGSDIGLLECMGQICFERAQRLRHVLSTRNVSLTTARGFRPPPEVLASSTLQPPHVKSNNNALLDDERNSLGACTSVDAQSLAQTFSQTDHIQHINHFCGHSTVFLSSLADNRHIYEALQRSATVPRPIIFRPAGLAVLSPLSTFVQHNPVLLNEYLHKYDMFVHHTQLQQEVLHYMHANGLLLSTTKSAGLLQHGSTLLSPSVSTTPSQHSTNNAESSNVAQTPTDDIVISRHGDVTIGNGLAFTGPRIAHQHITFSEQTALRVLQDEDLTAQEAQVYAKCEATAIIPLQFPQQSSLSFHVRSNQGQYDILRNSLYVQRYAHAIISFILAQDPHQTAIELTQQKPKPQFEENGQLKVVTPTLQRKTLAAQLFTTPKEQDTIDQPAAVPALSESSNLVPNVHSLVSLVQNTASLDPAAFAYHHGLASSTIDDASNTAAIASTTVVAPDEIVPSSTTSAAAHNQANNSSALLVDGSTSLLSPDLIHAAALSAPLLEPTATSPPSASLSRDLSTMVCSDQLTSIPFPAAPYSGYYTHMQINTPVDTRGLLRHGSQATVSFVHHHSHTRLRLSDDNLFIYWLESSQTELRKPASSPLPSPVLRQLTNSQLPVSTHDPSVTTMIPSSPLSHRTEDDITAAERDRLSAEFVPFSTSSPRRQQHTSLLSMALLHQEDFKEHAWSYLTSNSAAVLPEATFSVPAASTIPPASLLTDNLTRYSISTHDSKDSIAQLCRLITGQAFDSVLCPHPSIISSVDIPDAIPENSAVALSSLNLVTQDHRPVPLYSSITAVSIAHNGVISNSSPSTNVQTPSESSPSPSPSSSSNLPLVTSSSTRQFVTSAASPSQFYSAIASGPITNAVNLADPVVHRIYSNYYDVRVASVEDVMLYVYTHSIDDSSRIEESEPTVNIDTTTDNIVESSTDQTDNASSQLQNTLTPLAPVTQASTQVDLSVNLALYSHLQQQKTRNIHIGTRIHAYTSSIPPSSRGIPIESIVSIEEFSLVDDPASFFAPGRPGLDVSRIGCSPLCQCSEYDHKYAHGGCDMAGLGVSAARPRPSLNHSWKQHFNEQVPSIPSSSSPPLPNAQPCRCAASHIYGIKLVFEVPQRLPPCQTPNDYWSHIERIDRENREELRQQALLHDWDWPTLNSSLPFPYIKSFKKQLVLQFIDKNEQIAWLYSLLELRTQFMRDSTTSGSEDAEAAVKAMKSINLTLPLYLKPSDFPRDLAATSPFARFYDNHISIPTNYALSGQTISAQQHEAYRIYLRVLYSVLLHFFTVYTLPSRSLSPINDAAAPLSSRLRTSLLQYSASNPAATTGLKPMLGADIVVVNVNSGTPATSSVTQLNNYFDETMHTEALGDDVAQANTANPASLSVISASSPTASKAPTTFVDPLSLLTDSKTGFSIDRQLALLFPIADDEVISPTARPRQFPSLSTQHTFTAFQAIRNQQEQRRASQTTRPSDDAAPDSQSLYGSSAPTPKVTNPILAQTNVWDKFDSILPQSQAHVAPPKKSGAPELSNSASIAMKSTATTLAGGLEDNDDGILPPVPQGQTPTMVMLQRHTEKLNPDTPALPLNPPRRIVLRLPLPSRILHPSTLTLLMSQVGRKTINSWTLAYSLSSDGADVSNLWKSVQGYNHTLFIIKNNLGDVIGGYNGSIWQPQGGYHGNYESFVFNINQDYTYVDYDTQTQKVAPDHFSPVAQSFAGELPWDVLNRPFDRAIDMTQWGSAGWLPTSLVNAHNNDDDVPLATQRHLEAGGPDSPHTLSLGELLATKPAYMHLPDNKKRYLNDVDLLPKTSFVQGIPQIYPWKGPLRYYVFTDKDAFGWGGGNGVAIYVWNNLGQGKSEWSASFQNPQLTQKKDWRIYELEIWVGR